MKVPKQIDSHWIQKVQVRSCLQTREEYLGSSSVLSSTPISMGTLTRFLHITTFYQIDRMESWRWRHKFPSTFSLIPITRLPLQSKPVMRPTQRGAEGNWNLAQRCSKIYSDFSVEIKEREKHTHTYTKQYHSKRAFRGENICRHGQNKSSTKWNKCLWEKMCHSRERNVFLFPRSSFSFCPFMYQAVSSPSIKDAWIEYILWVGLLSESTFKIKVFYLCYLNSKHVLPKLVC